MRKEYNTQQKKTVLFFYFLIFISISSNSYSLGVKEGKYETEQLEGKIEIDVKEKTESNVETSLDKVKRNVTWTKDGQPVSDELMSSLKDQLDFSLKNSKIPKRFSEKPVNLKATEVDDALLISFTTKSEKKSGTSIEFQVQIKKENSDWHVNIRNAYNEGSLSGVNTPKIHLNDAVMFLIDISEEVVLKEKGFSKEKIKKIGALYVTNEKAVDALTEMNSKKWKLDEYSGLLKYPKLPERKGLISSIFRVAEDLNMTPNKMYTNREVKRSSKENNLINIHFSLKKEKRNIISRGAHAIYSKFKKIPSPSVTPTSGNDQDPFNLNKTSKKETTQNSSSSTTFNPTSYKQNNPSGASNKSFGAAIEIPLFNFKEEY